MINGIDIYHGDDITPNNLSTMIRSHQLCFAFIKTGTGASGKDSLFTKYWQLSRDSGLICGPYHWFWPSTDPTLQAINALSQINKVSTTGTLPPVVDIEWTWNKNDPQTDANELWRKVPANQRVSRIREYLTKIETELKVKPTIYTATSFWNELILDHSSSEDNIFFGECGLWLADPSNNGKIPEPWKNKVNQPLFIQTHFGESATTTDPYDVVDQDVFNGTLLQLLNCTINGLTITKNFPFSNIVKELQQQLVTKGFLNDKADGFFGNNTFNATSAFQTANGLIGNGIIDAQTWNKLLA